MLAEGLDSFEKLTSNPTRGVGVNIEDGLRFFRGCLLLINRIYGAQHSAG